MPFRITSTARSALAQLPGRKYPKKRNLLAQASGLYRWSCEMLNSKQYRSVLCSLEFDSGGRAPTGGGDAETGTGSPGMHAASFRRVWPAGLACDPSNGRPVAFSIYEAISPTTVAIHFERALRSYKGLYQVINCETAKVIAAQGFQFINREEDLGDAGSCATQKCPTTPSKLFLHTN